jgi:hypothetical protein
MMTYQGLLNEMQARNMVKTYVRLPNEVRCTLMVALDQTDDRLREHLYYAKRNYRPELAALCQAAAQMVLDVRADREGR